MPFSHTYIAMYTISIIRQQPSCTGHRWRRRIHVSIHVQYSRPCTRSTRGGGGVCCGGSEGNETASNGVCRRSCAGCYCPSGMRSLLLRLLLLVAILCSALLLLPGVAEARPHNNNRRHKQRSRIDRAWRERRTQCENSAACGHLEEHPKLLCSLRCLSSDCYGTVYGPPADELEEGEIDTQRCGKRPSFLCGQDRLGTHIAKFSQKERCVLRRERSFEDCVRAEEKQRQQGGGSSR